MLKKYLKYLPTLPIVLHVTLNTHIFLFGISLGSNTFSHLLWKPNQKTQSIFLKVGRGDKS